MKQSLVPLYIEAWQRQHDESLARNLEVWSNTYDHFDMTSEAREVAKRGLLEFIRKDYAHALEIAKQMVPHFPRHQVQYMNDFTEISFVSDVAWRWQPCVHFRADSLTIHNLHHPNARKNTNKALQIRGIEARIGWRNGQPTITKGYWLDGDERGGYSIYENS